MANRSMYVECPSCQSELVAVVTGKLKDITLEPVRVEASISTEAEIDKANDQAYQEIKDILLDHAGSSEIDLEKNPRWVSATQMIHDKVTKEIAQEKLQATLDEAQSFIEENDPQEKIASQDLEINRLSYENDQLQEENSRLSQKVINMLQVDQDKHEGAGRLQEATLEAAQHEVSKVVENLQGLFSSVKTAWQNVKDIDV